MAHDVAADAPAEIYDIESAGFDVRGVAQALLAISQSEQARYELGWALNILGNAALAAAEKIEDFVEASQRVAVSG